MLDLTALQNAVSSLKNAVAIASDANFMVSLDDKTAAVFKAGVVQNFEFTYELCWKFIKRWLSENESYSLIDSISRKDLFRKGMEYKLIDNFEKWMIFHKARNMTSHTYNKNAADEICNLSAQFLPEAEKLLNTLVERND
ncbi:MAG TPA: nucleotidyltransferase substrate binding protein [Spirochaetota bacterium]|nr:nucleotidyltransferase substrate binding protein [Spirochaetota bacterium]